MTKREGGWVYIMTNKRNGTLYVGVTSSAEGLDCLDNVAGT